MARVLKLLLSFLSGVFVWSFLYFGVPWSGPSLAASKARVWELGMKTWNLTWNLTARRKKVEGLHNSCITIPLRVAPTEKPQYKIHEVVPMTPEPQPLLPFPRVETTKKRWKGHCSFPTYIPEHVQNEVWFPRYLYHLERVDLSTSSIARRHINCARWWYATPQITYDEIPHRDIHWEPPEQPPPSYVRPKCPFGQKKVRKTRCARLHEVLWRTLDSWGILYFPRCGTELGVLRGSGYVTSDGDIDVFIDYPPKYLVNKLRYVLKPRPYLSGKAKNVKTETHWLVRGCPAVHMVFNDWMADEMVREFGRPTHMDTCECMMNSVKMTCHKQALRRTYLMYGPSWRVPLHAKGLDVPHRARPYNIAGKLKKWASADGIIHEETVQKLDKKIEYDDVEMEMSLAHLNVLKNLIDYQRKTKDLTFV